MMWKQSVGAILLVLVLNVGSVPKRKHYLVETKGETPLVGRGKVQDVKPKPEKNGSTKGTTKIPSEGTTKGTIKGPKLEKLKSAIEEMNLKITEGKNVTTKEFTSWLGTIMDIVGIATPGDKGHHGSRPSEHGSDYADYMAGLDWFPQEQKVFIDNPLWRWG
eukprot:TRINITY_DN4650_c0_g1_i3.p1 TRINITY_DN4650_c0_g1~~TRINITY_DN4650_c0_g1_i3.p1  ORF type:complete len:162 (+),score=43.10 TRINITY_DN4650_c0_g1_i3:3-488(+)